MGNVQQIHPNVRENVNSTDHEDKHEDEHNKDHRIPWFISTYWPKKIQNLHMTFDAEYCVYTTDSEKLNALHNLPTPPVGDPEFRISVEDVQEIVNDIKRIGVNNLTIYGLVQVLNSNIKESNGSDADIIRMLYYWFATIDVEGNQHIISPNMNMIEYHLSNIRKNKTSYAALFALLCTFVNIPCVIIRGTVKGGSYSPGEKMKSKYTREWNAVLVDGNWRLVDVFWGTCNKTLPINPWFLFPNPEELRYSHFPDVPAWQLLSEPITHAMFENQAYLKPRCFEMKMTPISHPYGEIKCEGNDEGQIEMIFKLDDDLLKNQKFRCLTKVMNAQQKWEVVKLEGMNEGLQVDFIYKQVKEGDDVAHDTSALSVTVRFPKDGVYKLELVGTTEGDLVGANDDDFDWIAIYRVYVQNVPDWPVFFPRATEIGFGENRYLTMCGLDAVSHKKGQITCTAGTEIVFEFQIRDDAITKHVSLYYSLENMNPTEQNAKEDLQPIVSSEKKVTITIRFDIITQYVLSVSAILNDTDKGNVIKYMVTCERDGREILEGKIKEAKAALITAIDLKRNDDLQRSICLAQKLGVRQEHEVLPLYTEAESLLRHITLLKSIPEIGTGAVAALKSFTSPDRQVIKVTQSMFILLGEKPGSLKTWDEMRQKLTLLGKESLLRRVKLFDVKKVKEYQMKAIRELLGERLDLTEMLKASFETATVAKWIESVINAYKSLQEMS